MKVSGDRFLFTLLALGMFSSAIAVPYPTADTPPAVDRGALEAVAPNIPLARVAPKYFGLSFEEARRRAPAQMLPCPVFRLGGQKSPWLVSAADLAELIDQRRERVG